MDDVFRAGLRCPIEECSFELAIQCDAEEETVVVGAAASQAHSDYAHGGATVSLYDVPVLPGSTMDEQPEAEPEEPGRPRLIN